jgi:MFS transporter, DHA2 family, multidrug resistance protein
MSASAVVPRASRREWLGLAVIALPCVLYAMDLTVLNLAVPRISEDLRPSGAKLLWILDVYGFFVAGLLVTMGTLGDRIGRRRLLLVGAAAFGVASVAAAQARSADALIVARAFLGVAGATLAPSTLSLIRNMFLDPRQRTLAFGVWVSSYSTGSAIGPLLGGVVLQHFHWGAVFLLGVPVMALLLVAGPILLPESRDPTARPLDVASAGLSLLSVLAVIFGMKVAVQDGWGWLPAAAIAAGLAFGGWFVRRQRQLQDPLIDLALFRVRAFSASLGIYLLATLVTFGSYVIVGQYLQLVAGLSPLGAGLRMLPWSGSYILGSLLTPALVRRVRPASLMAGGLLVAAVGFAALPALMAFGVAGIMAASTLYSLGMAPVFTLGTEIIVGSAPPERAGAAAAISETSAEMGGALGIAVLGSIGTAAYRSRLSAGGLAGVGGTALDTLGGATDAAGHLSGAEGVWLLQVARDAFTHAVNVTAAICAVLSLLTAATVLATLRGVRRH